MEDHPISGVILQVLTEKLDDGQVLCKSQFATARGLLPGRNSSVPYWGSAHFVIRKLHQLHESGWEAVQQQVVPTGPYRGKTEIYRTPSNSQMLNWLAPKVGGINPLRSEKINHWRICCRPAETPSLLTGQSQDKANFRWMDCPPGHFYADPFLIEHQGQVWLFF